MPVVSPATLPLKSNEQSDNTISAKQHQVDSMNGKLKESLCSRVAVSISKIDGNMLVAYSILLAVMGFAVSVAVKLYNS